MIVGLVLLVDGLRRFAIDVYKILRPTIKAGPAAISTLTVNKTSEEKLPPLKEAA